MSEQPFFVLPLANSVTLWIIKPTKVRTPLKHARTCEMFRGFYPTQDTLYTINWTGQIQSSVKFLCLLQVPTAVGTAISPKAEKRKLISIKFNFGGEWHSTDHV